MIQMTTFAHQIKEATKKKYKRQTVDKIENFHAKLPFLSGLILFAYVFGVVGAMTAI